jgi:hypothetical protein
MILPTRNYVVYIGHSLKLVTYGLLYLAGRVESMWEEKYTYRPFPAEVIKSDQLKDRRRRECNVKKSRLEVDCLYSRLVKLSISDNLVSQLRMK